MAAKLEVKHQLLENGSYSDKTLWMSAAIGKIFCALHLVNYFFSWHMDCLWLLPCWCISPHVLASSVIPQQAECLKLSVGRAQASHTSWMAACQLFLLLLAGAML
ncbi:TPA: hypothetical protein ACH3X1_015871 [Trebouxia sp. C0004]